MNQVNILNILSSLIFFNFANGVPGRALTFNIDDEWNLIPDKNWKLHNVHKSEIIEEDLEALFDPVEDIFFYLFTRENPFNEQLIKFNDIESIKQSNFNANNPTRIIIHGWQNNNLSDVNLSIRMAYLQKDDFNVIVVDWGRGAKTINYISARWRVPQVGLLVAQFIDFMVLTCELSINRLALVGHSLGAHASGIAGKNVKSGKISAIFGLVPASPLFYLSSPNDRINKGDAERIEIIHTNGGKLGFADPIGDIDFYPNGGSSQNGCGLDLVGTCAHSRAVEYYWESINSPFGFWAIPCQYTEVYYGKCTRQGGQILMGGDLTKKDPNGVYYLQTASTFPFALGHQE